MTSSTMLEKQNDWEVIALSSEVFSDKPISRRKFNKEFVLFRNLQGEACVLEDICAHRRAPLSLGKITKEGNILCPYHGWTYEGKNGKCTNIPNLSSSEKTPDYKVKHFTSYEQDGFIYLWHDSNSKPPPSPKPIPLDKDTPIYEGSQLITITKECFIRLLIDSPSLVLNINEVTIIDNHIMGEPIFDGGTFEVERAVDWTKKAIKRKSIASDLPLVLRIKIQGKSTAHLELIDDSSKTIASAYIKFHSIIDSVTSVFWKWQIHDADKMTLSKSEQLLLKKLRFNMTESISPSKIIKTQSYMSDILNQRIASFEQLVKNSLRGNSNE